MENNYNFENVEIEKQEKSKPLKKGVNQQKYDKILKATYDYIDDFRQKDIMIDYKYENGEIDREQAYKEKKDNNGKKKILVERLGLDRITAIIKEL